MNLNKGIKVVKKGNKITAKGMPERTKGILLAGILILILVLFVGSISPNKFNPTVIAIFALVIIVGSIIHTLKERKKAIREYNQKEVIEKLDPDTEIEEARRNLEAAEKRLTELERRKGDPEVN